MTLEELLNKLIKKGWKPFGVEATKAKENHHEALTFYYFETPNLYCGGGTWKYESARIRQIVSKESGLWQFVCENKLYTEIESGKELREKIFTDIDSGLNTIDSFALSSNYLYRLIESALTDEDKLEEFLLNNIKVDKKSEFEELVDRNIDVAKRLASK